MAASSAEPGPFGRALAWSPLVWVGRRSYGLYLWHWPIYVMVDAELDIEGPVALAVKLGFTFGISMLSYRLLETPVRQGALGSRQVVVLVGSVIALILLILVSTSVFQPEPDGLEAVELAGDGDCAREALDELAPRGQRVLLVGDSVALTLSFHVRSSPAAADTTIRTCATLGCGITGGTVIPTGPSTPPDAERCETWPEDWNGAVTTFEPDVSVILIGAWEVFDRMVDGELIKVGTPEFEAHLRNELDLGADILAQDGKPVVILTSPCFDDTDEWTAERDPERVTALNEVIVAWSTDRADVDLVDLHGLTCPDGIYQREVDGVTLHRDGVHYLPDGAVLVWEWLIPQLDAAVN
jgi:hypothetical protein